MSVTAVAKSGASQDILTHEEEKALAKSYIEHHCLASRDKIILAYRRLVMNLSSKVAKSYGINPEDLLSEANAAMLTCIPKFNPELGHRFGTLARHHIEGALHRYAMDNHGPCRVGTNSADKKVFSRYRNLRSEWEAKNRIPLNDEGRKAIADALGVKLNIVLRMEPRIHQTDISLYEPVGAYDSGDSISFIDTLESSEQSPEYHALENDRHQACSIIAELIEELPERERMIMQARISDDGPGLTELGQQFGITKERVRQIELQQLRDFRQTLTDLGYAASDLIGEIDEA